MDELPDALAVHDALAVWLGVIGARVTPLYTSYAVVVDPTVVTAKGACVDMRQMAEYLFAIK